jgi:undecaprenyl diphosphate synthase
VAIIMDGNGRWAEARGLPRVLGHREGARTAQAVIRECNRLGVRALTLFSFSSENWKRPTEEVDALMTLYCESLVAHRPELVREGVRFRQIGRLEGLPKPVVDEVRATVEATRGGSGVELCLAVNYGGRAEIVDACRAIAERVARSELSPDEIDDRSIEDALYTRGMPELDLMVRTAGEMRVSNFLLWQVSYAELHVSNCLWPDFAAERLHDAFRDFSGRRRRFGGLDSAKS